MKFSSQPTRCPFFEFLWHICVLSHLCKQGGKRQFLRLFGTCSRFFGNNFKPLLPVIAPCSPAELSPGADVCLVASCRTTSYDRANIHG